MKNLSWAIGWAMLSMILVAIFVLLGFAAYADPVVRVFMGGLLWVLAAIALIFLGEQ